jgi:hypothetical protein
MYEKEPAMSRIFGEIAQLGYVVRDVRASMEHWVRHGVGPWFYIEHVKPTSSATAASTPGCR